MSGYVRPRGYKAWVADRLVRLAAWPINRAYIAGQIHGHKTRERLWAKGDRLVHWALRAGFKVDADTAGERAACEGWWG